MGRTLGLLDELHAAADVAADGAESMVAVAHTDTMVVLSQEHLLQLMQPLEVGLTQG